MSVREYVKNMPSLPRVRKYTAQSETSGKSRHLIQRTNYYDRATVREEKIFGALEVDIHVPSTF